MGTIRAAIAGLERTEILERIWTAKEEKRRRGELAQSKIVLPWGVGYEEDRGFYYKPEAQRIREAFDQFLAGKQSYARLAQLVGVTPRGMHLILRNPIWTGVRVIDKKRDTSAAGRYAGKNGRQADRRKIARSPDEVIRLRVIDEPLISQTDFRTVQEIMDLKQKKHWRSRTNEHRFTYNGFLTCSRCGEIIHTALARRDYYACKGRRTFHTCQTRYMARKTLEDTLDCLFAERLTSPAFLERCVSDLLRRSESSDSVVRMQRLTSALANARHRRERVIDTFLDEVISREEQEKPLVSADLSTLAEVLAPLAEWDFWNREQKRKLLSALVPDIKVADYKVAALGLNPTIFSNEDTHMDRDSWLRRA
jgi:Recombinase